MRDLVQNFYDELGPRRFKKEFRISVEKRDGGIAEIRMSMSGRPFSYEWLSYIGGTTKKDNGGTVGMYGEGFKICALVLIRDFGAELTMRSSDWEISPFFYEERVDGTRQEMLGYHLWDHEDDGITELMIRSAMLGREAYDPEEAMMEFYYDGNPLIGGLIAESPLCRIHRRTRVPVPCREKPPLGLMFSPLLARGPLADLPLAVSYDARPKKDTRDRNDFPVCSMMRRLYLAFETLDSKGALAVLNEMKKWWGDLPRRRVDVSTKYYLICSLVRKVASDRECKEKFMEGGEPLCYMERPDGDTKRNRIRVEAARWWDSSAHGGIRKVNPIFRLLGAKSVMEEYLKNGKERYLSPGQEQGRRISLAMDCVKALMPDYLEGIGDIEALICRDPLYSFTPLLFSSRTHKETRNKSALVKQTYKIEKLVFPEEVVEKGSFDQLLLLAGEALVSVYGTKRSAAANAVLTDFAGRLCDCKGIVGAFRSQFEKEL